MHAQLCTTLGDPKGWSPPSPSVHGISQARILEWVDPRIESLSLASPALAGGFFTTEPPGFLGATMLKIYTYMCGYLINVSHSVDVRVTRVDITAVFSHDLIL